jgi:hypothetical protein
MEAEATDCVAGIQRLAAYKRDLVRAKARTAEYFEIMADLAGSENVSEVWQNVQATGDR